MTTRKRPSKKDPAAPRDLLARRLLALERTLELTNARLDVIGITLKHQTETFVNELRALGDRIGRRLDDQDRRLAAVEGAAR
jgi:hypothetical protein